MFQGVYNISLWKGRRTEFHKKYSVFDGLGSVFFDSLRECRVYVRLKSLQLKNIYEASKNFYKTLSEHYFIKHLSFRLKTHVSNSVNALLCDCLECYKFLSREIFPHYAVNKIKLLLNYFSQLADLLKLKFVKSRVSELRDNFFTEYPAYRSADYKKNNKIIINQNEKKKCII